MMTHSMVLTNVVIKTSKLFKQRRGIWQDSAIAKEMTLTALVHRPPRVAVLGTVENRKLSTGVMEEVPQPPEREEGRGMYLKERSRCASDGGYDSSDDGSSVATSTDEDGLTMGVVCRLNRLVCLQ